MGTWTLLRFPYVLRLLLGTLVGRLPTGMAALAISLVLREAGAAYGFVGFAAGTYAVASAAGGPVLGRLVDRLGQTRVLLPSAVLAGAGFAAIAAAPGRPAVVIAGAVAAGAATPPLEPCLRALWPRIVPPERLESAFALDSGAQELIFVTGPLLVAACAGAQSPSAALWLAAFLGLAGTLVVAAAPPSRAWTPPVGSAGWLGPLRSGPLVMLLISLVGAGAAVGGLTIMVVSYAERNPVPGGAGALLALNAGGALVGALVYGGVRWQAPPRRRAVLLAAGLATAYWLLCLPVPPVAMAALMAVTGLFLAPLLAVAFLLVDGLAPPGTTTEAFAWLVTLFAVGMALGTAIGGVLLQHSGQTAAAAAGAAGATGCALVLLAARRGLRLQPAT